MDNQPTIYTDKDLLKILKIKDTGLLRELIATGQLGCKKVGRFYRYTEKHLNDYLNSK